MKPVLLTDFGSTYTKLTAVDVDTARVLGTAAAYTTVQTDVNDGFSGGERKKTEILQMCMLEPKLTMLDEIDSGLDVDAVRIVSETVSQYHNENNSILVITHHSEILQHLKPDFVHVLINGRIVKSGDASLIQTIEANGYESFRGQAE